MPEKYESTWDSIETHELPDWFNNAKLGIFIHWGAYSVPAWAPVSDDDISKSGYAEWYVRGMYDEDSTIHDYHAEHYGEDYHYEAFLDEWNAEEWDPERWAKFFADEVGARYVVFTAEHHDGVSLWDSDITDWTTVERGPGRDIVGELSEAVRDRGLKFAGSFHALLNFHDPDSPDPGLFNHPDIDDEGHPGSDYIEMMNEKLRELIDKTHPDLLWLDGEWKASAEKYRTKETVAHYYNQAEKWNKEVAVNDRLGAGEEGKHGDFYTPEYETYNEIFEHKWEATRGLAGSFGYNRNESNHHYLTVEELVHSFVDVVSKNGNLLINVGPKANGRIPEIQKERLSGLGEWLDVNGEAIFDTTYWETSGSELADGTEIRYTWRNRTLYAILLGWPIDTVTIPLGAFVDETPESVTFMADTNNIKIDWTIRNNDVIVDLPEASPDEHPGHAYVLQLTDVPNTNREK